MSLLNNMLKDLERRDANATDGHPVTRGVRSVAKTGPAIPWHTLAWLGAGLVVLLSALWFWSGWRPLSETPLAADSSTNAVLPAPEAASPAPAETASSPPASDLQDATAAAVALSPSPAPVANTVAVAPPVAAVAVVAPATRREGAPVARPTAVAGNDAPTPTAVAAQAPVQKLESPRQKALRLQQVGLAQLREGKLAEGMASMRASLQADETLHEARHTLALLLWEQGQRKAAETVLVDGLQWPNGSTPLLQLLGRMALEQGDLSTAERWLRQGLALAPTDALLHGLLGTALREQERCPEASTHYLAALRQDPTMPGWLIGVAMCWEGMGLRADARDAWERAARSGRLSGDLGEFVEARLLALGR